MAATTEPLRMALMWHGDREPQAAMGFEGSRFRPVAEALWALGVEAVPVVYNDDAAEEVRGELLAVDGVQVWVNPIEQGHDRSVLDALLRGVAGEGVFVSAHPDIIQKMGTKEVLVSTREMSWGC